MGHRIATTHDVVLLVRKVQALQPISAGVPGGGA